MNQKFNSRMFKTLLPYFILALLVIIAFRVITELRYFLDIFGWIWGVITPFFYGFILAYILNIPGVAIQNLLSKIHLKFFVKGKKAISILIVLLLLVAVIALVFYLVIPSVYRSIVLFASLFNEYTQTARDYVDEFNELNIFGISINIDEIITRIWTTVQGLSVESLTAPLTALFGVGSALFRGFLTLVSAIYFMSEMDKFKAFLSRVLRAFSNHETTDAVVKYGRRLNDNFKQYIKTQTLDGLLLGSIVLLELSIMGSPYAVILAIMLGVLNYIPYFGSIVGSLIAILVVLITQGVPMALIASVVLLITQQIDGNFIQPRLLGSSFSLSPLLVIISVTIGNAVAGVLGMIAVVPIVSVLKDILDSIIDYLEKRKTAKEAMLSHMEETEERLYE